MSLTPPGAASASGSSHSKNGSSDGPTEQTPVVNHVDAHATSGEGQEAAVGPAGTNGDTAANTDRAVDHETAGSAQPEPSAVFDLDHARSDHQGGSADPVPGHLAKGFDPRLPYGPAHHVDPPPLYDPSQGFAQGQAYDPSRFVDSTEGAPSEHSTQTKLAEPSYSYPEAPSTEPLARAPIWPLADTDDDPVPRGPARPAVSRKRPPLLAPSARRRPPSSKGRRVKRVVRRIELWSVLKVSLLFYGCMYIVTMTAGVLLWGFAYSAGLIENFESFMADIGFDDFQFFGNVLFREAAIVGAVLVLAGSLLTVMAVALINLISEVTGGIRFVIIEIDADDRSSNRQDDRSDAGSNEVGARTGDGSNDPSSARSA